MQWTPPGLFFSLGSIKEKSAWEPTVSIDLFCPPKIFVQGPEIFRPPRTPLEKNGPIAAEEIHTCSFTMEPEHEPDTGEDQVVDEVFQYITTLIIALKSEEGKKRRKAKQFEVDNGDLM